MSNKMALDALTAALDAMEHMANTLNNMDAVDEDEDAQHDAAFEAVRAAIAALKAQPQGWIPFDYANPPEDGLMFVAASAPETDCDVDDYGKTVGWHTGEIERTVCMVSFSAGPDRDHDFQPVAEYDTGKVPAEGWVTHYMRVQLPALPSTPPKD